MTSERERGAYNVTNITARVALLGSRSLRALACKVTPVNTVQLVESLTCERTRDVSGLRAVVANSSLRSGRAGRGDVTGCRRAVNRIVA
jgi:hypothetical protein